MQHFQRRDPDPKDVHSFLDELHGIVDPTVLAEARQMVSPSHDTFSRAQSAADPLSHLTLTPDHRDEFQALLTELGLDPEQDVSFVDEILRETQYGATAYHHNEIAIDAPWGANPLPKLPQDWKERLNDNVVTKALGAASLACLAVAAAGLFGAGKMDDAKLTVASQMPAGQTSRQLVHPSNQPIRMIEMPGSGPIAKIPEMSEEALAKVAAIATDLGVQPNWLLAVISFETGGTFSPSVKNKLSGATGLIQFMPETAEGLGTSTAALSRMSQVEQLEYVKRYFEKYDKISSLNDLYMAVLWPRGVGKPDSYVLFSRGTTTYSQNSGLDINEDGQITKHEAAAKVREHLDRITGKAAYSYIPYTRPELYDPGPQGDE
jgi:hypothetical protein